MRSNGLLLNRGVAWIEIRIFGFKRRRWQDARRSHAHPKIIWEWNKQRREESEWDKRKYFRIVVLNRPFHYALSNYEIKSTRNIMNVIPSLVSISSLTHVATWKWILIKMLFSQRPSNTRMLKSCFDPISLLDSKRHIPRGQKPSFLTDLRTYLRIHTSTYDFSMWSKWSR